MNYQGSDEQCVCELRRAKLCATSLKILVLIIIHLKIISVELNIIH